MIQRELFHTGFLPPAWAYGIGVALAAAVLALLWQEIRRNRRALRWLLPVMRAGMVVVLTLLLAQPNLLITTRLQHQGRTLAFVDDSASMFAVDSWTAPHDQVSLASLMALPDMGGRPADFQHAADSLRTQGESLAALNVAVASAMADIRKGLPWSDRAQEAMAASQPALKALQASLEALQAQSRPDAGARQLARETAALLGPGKERGTPLFSGGPPLQQADWTALEDTLTAAGGKLTQLRDRLVAQQADADRDFLAAGGRQAAVNGLFRDLTRYGLARRVIAGAGPLSSGETLNLYQKGGAPVEASSAAPRTDLVQTLASALHDRPLDLINALYVFSDGAQNCIYDLDALDIYRRRGVPLVVVGVGAERSDESLMLADMDCPRLVSARTPLALTLDLRAHVPVGTRIDLAYDLEGEPGSAPPEAADAQAGRPLAGSAPTGHALPYHEVVVTAGQGWLHHRALLRVSRPGFQRLRVDLSVGEPAVKVTRTIPVFVCADKPAILLVAEQPDPLSMSVLAQKRFGVNVFPVFTYRKEANARRGETKSLLPKAGKDWARYDLVVLCGRPFPGFTAEDAAAIGEAVRTKGLSVLVAGDRSGAYAAALEPALGMKAPAAPAPVTAPPAIVPPDDVLHLPMLQLSTDLIRNQNIWLQFQTPGTWWSVPEQRWTLVRQTPTQAPVMTLGFHGAGRVVYCGLGEWGRMNEWRPAFFEKLVTRMVMDLLMPTGEWADGKAGLGVYPGTGVPGRASLIVARSANAADASLELKVEAPNGKATAFPLEGRDGWFQLPYVFLEEGTYKLTVGSVQRAVEVRRLESSETRDLSLREDFLRELASSAGGIYVPLRDLPDALKQLSVKTRESLQTRTIRTLDFTIELLVLFLLLASADFALRKQIGMVL